MRIESVPWQKILIWSLFLLAIYTLRHFFFVIFMTFIVSYSVRNLVTFLRQRFFARNNTRFLEPMLVIGCFLGLLGGLYGVGAYLVPEFVSQANTLVRRLGNPQKSPKAKLDELLRDSVGRYLFHQKYGERGSDAYLERFRHLASGVVEYDEFGRQLDRVREAFGRHLVDTLASEKDSPNTFSSDDVGFQEWVLKNKAEKALQENRTQYLLDWERSYRRQLFESPGIISLEKLPSELRHESILRYVTKSLLADPGVRSELEEEWLANTTLKFLKEYEVDEPKEYEERFREFYLNLAGREQDLPFSYDEFSALRKAYSEGSQSFIAKLREIRPTQEPANLEKAETEFERRERQRLLVEWKRGDVAAKLGAKLAESVLSGATAVGVYIGEAVPKILLMPVEFLLALLLSFLITIDIPRLRKGVDKLLQSRVREVYLEIAPGLTSFAKLIGRAFQAQAVIAVANTVLTFIAIKFLGIQNAAFLSTVVFLCSFVPVLGVVFSSVPIAIMALIQEDGGLLLAVWSVVAVLIVHFIETSLLNPRILGNMLHLHPVLTLAILAISEHYFGVWGLLLGVPVVVYIIRFVILDEGIPGLIEPVRNPPTNSANIVP